MYRELVGQITYNEGIEELCDGWWCTCKSLIWIWIFHLMQSDSRNGFSEKVQESVSQSTESCDLELHIAGTCDQMIINFTLSFVITIKRSLHVEEMEERYTYVTIDILQTLDRFSRAC